MSGLRACLLSGGASRRMGTDKALLPHPAGGTWLEFSLAQLAALPLPITLVSHHRAHQALALCLRDGLGNRVHVLEEPPPREGPLLALVRLMHHHPDQDLLLCPVDMPWLQTAALEALVAAASTSLAVPAAIHLAHDARRLQPLLGVYPAHADRRRRLG
ncbi:NTP transferase domain-containing protein, partial [Cyanobium gracile]